MKSNLNLEKLHLKDLIKGLCINPSPFKLIHTFSEDASVLEAIEAFENSNLKRKVIGVKTNKGEVFHLGENEMKGILKKLEDQV
ncbi:hypothetical protein HZR84_11305 [Hyphobacterium sp. CCMP332]|nr:hypothetical protein HZR84_11305 [Hyphobacterium sp. CCMP332]